MTAYDTLASMWRTTVPTVAGFSAVQLLRLGVHLDDATLTALLTAGVGTGYYAVFRLAEQHLGRGWGWLLGLARPPQYKPVVAATDARPLS